VNKQHFWQVNLAKKKTKGVFGSRRGLGDLPMETAPRETRKLSWGSSLFSDAARWVDYHTKIPYHNEMFLFFIFFDLITTWIGLSAGFKETAPGAYLFGANKFIIMVWLLVQKLGAVFLLEFAMMFANKNPEKRKINLIALYACLAVLGLIVSLQNASRLWRFFTSG